MGTLGTMEDAEQEQESPEVLEYLAWLDQIAMGVDICS